MKTKIFTLLLIISTLIYKNASAQVLCIYCYDQNDSISHGVHNLILNGGFENNNCIPNDSSFCPNSGRYNCDITNWTCTGGQFSSYANIVDTSQNSSSIIIQGTKAVNFSNYKGYPCNTSFENDTSCLQKNNCSLIGIPSGYPWSWGAFGGDSGISLNQTLTGLTIGNTYVLEFWAGGINSPSNGLFAVNIGFGNIFLSNKPTPVSYTHLTLPTNREV